ncbi:MAG: hypothetical protein IJE50_06510, partial [Clostridia bacterium]|nr:hypothetical protein [Clostridia bacterium]
GTEVLHSKQAHLLVRLSNGKGHPNQKITFQQCILEQARVHLTMVNYFDKFSKGQQTSRVHFEWQHFCGGSTNFTTANDACSFQLHGGHN